MENDGDEALVVVNEILLNVLFSTKQSPVIFEWKEIRCAFALAELIVKGSPPPNISCPPK